MSQEQFQNALALLIRCPDDHRMDEFPEFINKFTLTDRERRQLKDLASQRAVTKYGWSMQGVRVENAIKKIGLLHHFVANETLEWCWKKFEPHGIYKKSRFITPWYMRFMYENEECRKAIVAGGPDFVLDILLYEIAQHSIRFDGFDPVVNEGSLLKDTGFVVTKMSHDIGAFINKMTRSQTPIDSLRPEKREVYCLFVKDQETEYRLFEIEKETYLFLHSQKQYAEGKTNQLNSSSIPSSYEDLVSLGIVENIN